MILQRKSRVALERRPRWGYGLCVAEEQTTIQTEELIKVLADKIGQIETENIALKLALSKREQENDALRRALESMAARSGADGD